MFWHPFSCLWLAVFWCIYCCILNYSSSSLPLFSLNSTLMYFQSNPQSKQSSKQSLIHVIVVICIWLLRVFFLNVKGEFCTDLLLIATNRTYLHTSTCRSCPDKKQLLLLSDKTIWAVSWESNQASSLFRSKQSSNWPEGTDLFWSFSLGFSLITFWVCAFWYWNAIFIGYAHQLKFL